ncbi:2638_t:CDS:2, partial [Dentiscutata heterogama]
ETNSEEATANEKELNKMGITIINAEEEEYDEDKDYQELLEQLVLELGYILTLMSVKPPKWGEPDRGVDYSNDDEWDNENIETWWQPEEDCMGDQEWRNNWYNDAEEYYSPALRFFNNGVPGLGLLTSPFPNSEETLEALESDDESTQSRGVVTPSKTGHDNDKTVITQKEKDRYHEISKEKEVFMIKIENEDEQKEGIEKDLSYVLPLDRTQTLYSESDKLRQDHILDGAIWIPTYCI